MAAKSGTLQSRFPDCLVANLAIRANQGIPVATAPGEQSTVTAAAAFFSFLFVRLFVRSFVCSFVRSFVRLFVLIY